MKKSRKQKEKPPTSPNKKTLPTPISLNYRNNSLQSGRTMKRSLPKNNLLKRKINSFNFGSIFLTNKFWKSTIKKTCFTLTFSSITRNSPKSGMRTKTSQCNWYTEARTTKKPKSHLKTLSKTSNWTTSIKSTNIGKKSINSKCKYNSTKTQLTVSTIFSIFKETTLKSNTKKMQSWVKIWSIWKGKFKT